MARDLSKSQLDQISRVLSDLGEQTFDVAESLRSAQFSAFTPYQEFMESFARDPREREIHRTYVRERTKAMLSIGSARYSSEILKQLRAAADCSPLRNDPMTEWIPRLHIDPCEQNAFVMKVREPQEYERRDRAMIARRRHALEVESARHSTALASQFLGGMLLKPMRFAFAVRVLEQGLTQLGFRRITGNAGKGDVILAKPLTADWQLDWTIADPDLFYYSPSSGSLTLNLKLRSTEIAKSDRSDVLGTVFSIGYTALVYGFSAAYMEFWDLASLETSLKAHVQLYTHIDPVFVGALVGLL